MKYILKKKKLFKKLLDEGKKGKNKIKILNYVFNNQVTSISNICNDLHISIPTAMTLTKELFNEKWIQKKGFGDSIGGRRPDLIGLTTQLLYVLCINIEIFDLKMAILDNNLEFQTEIYRNSFPISKKRENIHRLFDKIKDFLKQENFTLSQISGISITLPGLINSETGENFTYFIDNEGLQTFNEYCESYLKVPVIVQNDVKAGSLAELKYGIARGKKEALILFMDWGVGLGIIMDGKIQKGVSGFSGEIGHIPFKDNGDLCYCGKHGCLETVASGNALSKMAKEGILSGQNSILNELTNKEINKIETSLIIEAANRGDLFSIRLLSDIGTSMGKSISTLIQIFNPELIVLEGKIAEAKEYITLPMLQSINTYCMMQIREQTKIVSSNLGERANLIGGAFEVIDKIFDIDF